MRPGRELLRWPALSGLGDLPDSLPLERAVWGKVHGQSSEFRWIARSPGLAGAAKTLEREIGLGSEDRPRDAVCWRALCDHQIGIGIYPSRARDGAGRGGFLEKQMLILRRHPSVPAALAAMVLLPRVDELRDDVWWPHRESGDWWNPDFALTLDRGHSPAASVTGHAVAAAIEEGVRALAETVDRRRLVSFYDDLLARRRPAALRGLVAPLPPAALAALLLPLPLELAETVSLAGWLPSSRASAGELAECWDGVVVPPGLLPAPSAESDRGSELAEEMVAALLAARPERLASPTAPRQPPATPPEIPAASAPSHGDQWRAGLSTLPRPGLPLPLTPPSGDSPILRRIYDFARAADRRWLDLADLDLVAQRSRLRIDPDARLLPTWVRETEEFRPPGADPEQWTRKVELLEKAARLLSSDGIDL